MDTEPDFNPALLEWLHERGYSVWDWQNDIPAGAMTAADVTFGDGQILDELGWPIPGASDYAFNYPHDPIYLGA